jgi:hypothetical protein
MKTNLKLQTGLFALLTFLLGFVIGIFIEFSGVDNENLAGTIGKVDRYRNVKVTENDILLRNELVEDTVKRSQYEKYLMYYYYQALRSANDLDMVADKTASVPEFGETHQTINENLDTYQRFLKTAQTDILSAMTMVISLDKNSEIPVISYLNPAQNAIARMQNQSGFMMDYMQAVAEFINENPGQTYPELEDAHDILSANLVQSAVLTQNKPLLKYLDNTRLMNDREGLNDLMNDTQFNDYFRDQFAMDVEKLGFLDSEMLGNIDFPIICDFEKLSDVVLSSGAELSLIFDVQQLGVFSDAGQLGIIIFDVEQLGAINDKEQLGAGFPDAARLGAYMDAAQLGVFMDIEQLGMGSAGKSD